MLTERSLVFHMVSQQVASRNRSKLGISRDQPVTLRALPYSRCANKDDPSGFAEPLHHIRGAHRCVSGGYRGGGRSVECSRAQR